MAAEITDVHHVMETIMNSLSILFNCYLLYLIKYYSTFGVKLYQYLLTIDAILDLCLGVGALLAQPVGLTGNGYTVMISNGFFTGHSTFLESLTATFYLVILHTNIIWIPVQFVYRYRLLCKKSGKSIHIDILIISVTITYSIIALKVLASFSEVRDEYQSIGQHVLGLNNWPSYKYGFIMGGHIKEWRMIAYVLLWTTTSATSIFIVIWCEKMIAKNFNQLCDMSHASTRRMHKEFQRALLAMAICPLFTTSMPVFYFMTTIAFQLCPGRVSAIMTICLSSISLFNPLTTIICFRCYRRAAARLLTCGRYNKDSVNSLTNVNAATSTNKSNVKVIA
ncbi:serpentine type 7TM GPCR chemoreceptor str domain-containing protein [Ditylenchus destructor]|uniref:Serpentine type 7TM GPCR chemoreceptor str domain-containing protein n=1 Tax=Ditylenchus destructor TaxID=166010 RepID=A0AAD4MWF7_9BILA|nr:serpentine type 7TM GPCR chemoreceptor str domain-containing protein [Ditylenchus destructor]